MTLSESMEMDRQRFMCKVNFINEVRSKYNLYPVDEVCGHMKRSLPQSDYDKALSELDKEFPGATIEPQAPSIEKRRLRLFFSQVMLVFAFGAIYLFVFAVF